MKIKIEDYPSSFKIKTVTGAFKADILYGGKSTQNRRLFEIKLVSLVRYRLPAWHATRL